MAFSVVSCIQRCDDLHSFASFSGFDDHDHGTAQYIRSFSLMQVGSFLCLASTTASVCPTAVWNQTFSVVAGSSNNRGSSSVLLNNPADMTVDGYFNLYVADSTNHRIQQFRPGNISLLVLTILLRHRNRRRNIHRRDSGRKLRLRRQWPLGIEQSIGDLHGSKSNDVHSRHNELSCFALEIGRTDGHRRGRWSRLGIIVDTNHHQLRHVRRQSIQYLRLRIRKQSCQQMVTDEHQLGHFGIWKHLFIVVYSNLGIV